jgi:hypothetical protein
VVANVQTGRLGRSPNLGNASAPKGVPAGTTREKSTPRLRRSKRLSRDNMGRSPWSSREVVENCYRLSVDAMSRDRVFSSPPGSRWLAVWKDASGNEQFRIGYNAIRRPGGTVTLHVSYGLYDTDSCTTKMLQYDIDTTTTACHFGGKRIWFRCPAVRQNVRCGRRVARLYLPSAGHCFACRSCHDLTYTSCRTHNKRLDALIQDPTALTLALTSNNLEEALLGVRAYTRLCQRLQKLRH